MKKIGIGIIAAVIVVAGVFTGCDLKKMTKKYETVKYEVTPNVLETKGGKISVKVTGTFPEKYFGKKAVAEFAPELKYATGSTKLKSITLQGEKVKGSGVVINKKSGGTFTFEDVIVYSPDMNKSELGVNVKITLSKKMKEMGERKLADGVIYTSERIEKEGDILIAGHGYEKEKIVSKSAEIYFAKAKSDLNLKTLALNKDTANIAKLNALVELIKKEWKVKDIDVNGWASPEGEEKYNIGLSEKRTVVAEKYIKDQIKGIIRDKAKANKQKIDEKNLDADMPQTATASKGEDWDGYMKIIGSSDLKAKDKIINVVNSQPDLVKKAKEINNMIVIYPEIEKVILPPLRRAIITINFYEPRKTDQQILEFATTKPDSLKNDELLYAATLTEDLAVKLQIYEAATKIYADDWKGFNNAGYTCLMLEKTDEASTYLEKANSMMPNNGIINNNLGVVAAWKKDFTGANTYFETAKGLGVDEGFNLGASYIKTGDFSGALASYGSRTCTHNIALAQLLTGNNSGATATLNCSNPKSAAIYYLLAVTGARSGNNTMIYDNLAKAIAADAKYREQAKDDREFLKYFKSAEFENAIK